jgi:hypothetical protein
MKKLLAVALILAGLLFPSDSEARKLNILKSSQKRDMIRKIHPLEREFSKPRKFEPKRNNNKLLVLLIEFNDNELIQDNPLTTGNGKFVQDPTGYPLSLGKPPHDHNFFSQQLEALKHYYRAASLYYDYGWDTAGFDLDYDIYPLPGENGEFQAYTLPEEMAYYSPTDVSYEVLVSRFEEYFQDCFTTADQDENIDFSQYEHFMLIHAGSDWQHDIFNDTPCDIPSFFIKIGTGKEVYVDDGIKIDHACNVPETISQDFQITTSNGIDFVEGYGLINAVMAHEFGHSVGFVDLYNTMNFYPAVGYYDIMDSGGLGRLTFPVNQNGEIDYVDYQYVFDLEGCLPILPGAWTRILAWEDDFRARGILQDISELEFDQLIELNPAEKKPDPNSDLPYFIKVPLNNNEYLLIENRQVDPDGDGGTAVQSTSDQRVILYPTPLNDENPDSTSYEYDYLLPGWFTPSGAAIGGGLVIWHIDEVLLYENDNFANNTVNPSRANRAVKIIEADNIEDIGNPQVPSWSWRGTEYDPFYKYSALLNDNGDFLDWNIIASSTGNIATHNDSLSGISTPALVTNNNAPSIYAIYDISSYDLTSNNTRYMSFKVGSYLFDNTEILAEKDSILHIGFLGNSFDFDTFPVISNTGVDFYSIIGNNWLENPFGTTVNIQYQPTLPVISLDYLEDSSNERNEFLIVEDNLISFLTPLHNSENLPFQLEFSSRIIATPLLINDVLVVPTEDFLYFDTDSLQIEYVNIAYDNNEILAITDNKIYFINSSDPGTDNFTSLPQLSGLYDPVTFIDTLNTNNNATFIQNDTGDIYKLNDHNLKKIFSLYPYTDKNPTNLALGRFKANENPALIFAAGNQVIALDLAGSLLQGFPKYVENIEFQAFSYPKIVNFGTEILALLETVQNGYLAVNYQSEIKPEYNIFWNKSDVMDQFYYDAQLDQLNFIYSDNVGNLYVSAINNIGSSIIWSGYRHNLYSIYYGQLDPDDSENLDMIAYAFPNPARNGEVRIRVIDDSEKVSLRIFDIAGNLVFNQKSEFNYSSQMDIIWDTRKIASGIYFGVVRTDNETKKILIAVEN